MTQAREATGQARVLRWVRTLLLAAAAVLLVAPLLLPPHAWRLSGAHRWLGLGSLSVVAVTYGLGRGAQGSAAALLGDRRTLGRADVILVVALPVYVLALANARIHTSGDNAATRALGPLIVRERTIDLSLVPDYQTEPLHYSAMHVGDRILPAYPIGTALLSVPYMGVALMAAGEGIRPRYINRWEKHLSALLASAATALLFLGARRAWGDAAALGASFVFAFATTAFSSMSQALWSTTGEVFFLCLTLWLLLPEDATRLGHLTAGFFMGAAFLCRPTAVLATAATALVVLLRRRAHLKWYGAGALVSMTAVLIVLFGMYGHPLGGYGLRHQEPWGHNVVEGLLGNLLSPSRGLIVFYPYLLLLPLAWRPDPVEPNLRRWLLGSLVALVSYYALASVFDYWWGGWSIGPRLMTEAAPYVALLTVPAWQRLRRRSPWRAPFLVAVAFAAATQALSVYSDRAERANRRLTDSAAYWSLRDSQIVAIWCPPCGVAGDRRPENTVQ